MKKIIPIALVVMAVAFIYVRFSAFRPNLAQMKVGSAVVRVDIADTVGKRQQGLSGRENLPRDQGMLFTFDAPLKYSFWMKDMRFPLDFIWIREGRVVDITENVPYPIGNSPPATVQPQEPATAVLEVNADFTERHSIKIGDAVDIDL